MAGEKRETDDAVFLLRAQTMLFCFLKVNGMASDCRGSITRREASARVLVADVVGCSGLLRLVASTGCCANETFKKNF
jgi:hypothetical protein